MRQDPELWLESKVEQYLIKEVKVRGGKCVKFTSPAQRSVPDRIIFLSPGIIRLTEVKRHTGVLSIKQDKWIRDIRSLGVTVSVVYGKAGVDELLVELDQMRTLLMGATPYA